MTVCPHNALCLLVSSGLYGSELYKDDVVADDAGSYECRIGELKHQITVKVVGR